MSILYTFAVPLSYTFTLSKNRTGWTVCTSCGLVGGGQTMAEAIDSLIGHIEAEVIDAYKLRADALSTHYKCDSRGGLILVAVDC